VLNLYKAYADLLTKEHLEGIHRQLWTDLTDNMKLNNVMVITAFFFSCYWGYRLIMLLQLLMQQGF